MRSGFFCWILQKFDCEKIIGTIFRFPSINTANQTNQPVHHEKRSQDISRRNGRRLCIDVWHHGHSVLSRLPDIIG
jgi:hypothetical protein